MKVLEVFLACCLFSFCFADVGVYNRPQLQREINVCDAGGGGVCTSLTNCQQKHGRPLSECPKPSDSYGPQVCCQFKSSCGDTVTQRVGMVQSQSYPDYRDADQSCTVNINTLSDVCQVRLDFIDFELPGPDALGICLPMNNLQIIAPRVPDGIFGGRDDSNKLCGVNTGQHLYIPVDELDRVQLLFTTKFSGNSPLKSKASSDDAQYRWKILVTQIECGSNSQDMRDLEAPEGCLQYNTDTSGEISSINFDSTARIGPNYNYKICFGLNDQAGETACRIEFRATSFGMPTGQDSPISSWPKTGDGSDCSSGRSTAAFTSAVTQVSVPPKAEDVPANTAVLCCTQRLGASLNTEEFNTGRFNFCGANFGSSPTEIVETRTKPFTLGVRTGGWGEDNRGSDETNSRVPVVGLAPIGPADIGFKIQYTIYTGVC